MGIDLPAGQLLSCARSLGADFSSTMMLGRQTINSEPAEFAPILTALGIPQSETCRLPFWGFAEPFFQLLGAAHIRSLDASDYQQATDIHDLNNPLPRALAQQFSAVFDGGTIEHVFNAPEAYRGGMDMVAVGGHFIQVTVANNYMGHGFWQMSPELIFRIFCRENGFRVCSVLLHEVIPGGAWYRVTDPAVCRLRVELCNDQPTYIGTIAQRIADVPIFKSPPQQSDYAAEWQQAKGVEIAPPPGAGTSSEAARSPPRNPAFDQPYYTEIPAADLIHGKLSM